MAGEDLAGVRKLRTFVQHRPAVHAPHILGARRAGDHAQDCSHSIDDMWIKMLLSIADG